MTPIYATTSAAAPALQYQQIEAEPIRQLQGSAGVATEPFLAVLEQLLSNRLSDHDRDRMVLGHEHLTGPAGHLDGEIVPGLGGDPGPRREQDQGTAIGANLQASPG